MKLKTLSLILLLTALAFGEDEPKKPKKEKEEQEPYRSAFAKAMAEGKPVLIVYSYPGSSCALCHGAQDIMLKDTTTRKQVHPKVVLIEISMAGETKDRRYFQYRDKFKGNTVPFWVLATPEGKFLDGGDYDTIRPTRGRVWRKRVLGVVAKHPPIPPDAREEIKETLAAARKDFEHHEYGEALAACEKLKAVWFPKALVDECRKLATDLEERERSLFEEAESLKRQDKPVEAALAYDAIARRFTPDTKAGLKARRASHAILSDNPKLREKYVPASRAAEAADLMAKAKRTEDEGDARQARRLYVTVGLRLADTPSADPAREAIKRIDAAAGGGETAKADEKEEIDKGNSAEKSDEMEAERLVRLARTYRSAKLNRKAKGLLDQCIEKYPETKAAKEARSLLKEWRL